MTDFRACGTIMGPAGLTAVFGMGTGVAPPVWSPESRPGGGQAAPGVAINRGGRTRSRSNRGVWPRSSYAPRRTSIVTASDVGGDADCRSTSWPGRPCVVRASGRGGQAIGCWDRSAAALARRALPAHRPGRLPGAFAASAAGNLVSEGASRLDAFSAYPVPTWLPGGAPSGTAGTPEVGPPQSSRTRGDAPQVSYAHGR